LRKGLLVAVEGIDGSGKTSVVRELEKRLKELKIRVETVREPSDGPIGEFIRKYLNREFGSEWDKKVEALLFAADRAWYFSEVGLPEGDVVLMDRSLYSSLAYQAETKEDEAWISEINKFVPKPHLSFFLDVRPEICISRIMRSGRRKTSKESLPELKRTYERYLDLVRRGYLIRVDAERGLEEVVEEILREILKRIASPP